MKELKLTKNDIAVVHSEVEQIASNPEFAKEKLIALGKDSENILKEISEGVNDFHRFYAGDVNPETIKAEIDFATKDMTNSQKYSYLAKLITAITHVGGRVYGDASWSQCMENHHNVLTALKLGLIQEDDYHISEGINEMLELISANVDAFAVMFVDNPDLAELQEACLTEDAEKVKAIALNTRDAAIHMATAIYILQEEGALKSLGETRYTPRDIGVMSASVLEIDAAQKTGSLDMVKKVFQKVSRTAVTLLIASPTLVAGLSLFGLISMLTNFATVCMIISAVAIGINLKAHYDVLSEKLAPVYTMGGRVLDATLDKVRPLYAKVSDWVQNTVAPNAMPIWAKCKTFVRTKVMIPAIAFILKTKDFVIKAADIIQEKSIALYEKAVEKARDIFNAAKGIANQENLNVAVVDEAPVVETDDIIVEDEVAEEEEEISEAVTELDE